MGNICTREKASKELVNKLLHTNGDKHVCRRWNWSDTGSGYLTFDLEESDRCTDLHKKTKNSELEFVNTQINPTCENRSNLNT